MSAPTHRQTNDPRLDRRAAMRTLLADRGELLVVTGLGSTTYDATAAGDNDRNFYLWGAMGGAAMIGLGIAIAQPDKKVLVVTGDGEMLMGLGSLATVGVRRPPNLAIAIFDNGHYGETGMQPSHTDTTVDLCGVARSCGFEAVYDISGDRGLAGIRRKIAQFRPHDVCPRRNPSGQSRPRVLPTRDGVLLKTRFRRSLGFE